MRFRYKKMHLVSTTHEEECGIKPQNYGYRMPSPIAAIGLNQIKKINNYNKVRRQSALRWDKWCEDHGYRKPMIIPDSEPVYLRYPVLVEEDKKRNTTWGPDQLGVRIGVCLFNRPISSLIYWVTIQI